MVARGTGEALSGLAGCENPVGQAGPITGAEPGSGQRAGRASEVVRSTARAGRTTQPPVTVRAAASSMRFVQRRAGQCLVASPTRAQVLRTATNPVPGGQGRPPTTVPRTLGKVGRRHVLERAWGQARRNRGAAGIDQTTLADVEAYGVDRLLDELACELRAQRWRPLAGMAGVHSQAGHQ
jgi:hypothetical protein